MPSLEVHELAKAEVYRDIVRINENHRIDKRGAVVSEGDVSLIQVHGRGKAWVVLRGNQEDHGPRPRILMDELTRRKLNVKFGETHNFDLQKAGLKGVWGLRWAWGASEMGYRLAADLATIGTVLAILGLGLGLWQTYISWTATHAVPPPSHSLTVGDVFSLRDKYGDLVGKTRDAVIERYGTAKPDEHDDWLVYSASAKTSNRPITFLLVDGKVKLVKVLKRDGEELDVLELVKKAPLFNFGSGTFTDTTKDYLIATTKDHRTAF